MLAQISEHTLSITCTLSAKYPQLKPAHQVISLIKGLAMEGVTVVATVHSPTAYAFSLFDR